jgi:hypothetical protein
MASEIRVNSITNRSGLGTVTFSDTGVVLSGVSTFSTGIVVAAGSASAPSISPSGDSNTGIFFPSPDTIAFAEGGVEALRIDSNANIGIGINLPGRKLEVCGPHSSGNITPSLKISGNGWSLNGGTALEFGQDPVNYSTWVTGRIASTYSGSSWGGGLKFFYNNGTTPNTLTEGMELTRDGNLAFSSGKGIDFSATANSSGTMTSEVLSDYEEGTWTPSLEGVTIGNGTITGQYTKIGNIVHLTFRFVFGSTSSISGGVNSISGLPFTNDSASNSGTLTASNASNNWFGFTQQYSTGTATNYIQFVTSSNIQLTMTSTVPFTWTTGNVLRFNMTYRAA